MLSAESNRFGVAEGFTISAAVREVPLMFAESVTLVATATAEVVTGKLALKLPAGTVTLAGTAALGSLLDKGTDNPPDGAAFARVTVPCALLPPTTAVGTTDNASAAGVTVTKPTLLALPPRPSRTCAVMANTVLVATAGGVKTAVAPLTCSDPPSADHWYCRVSPFKSFARTEKVAVCEALIVSTLAAGPRMKYGGTFAAPAGRPSTWISDRPVADPCAWLIVNRTHVTVFGANVTGKTWPSGGSAPRPKLVP